MSIRSKVIALVALPAVVLVASVAVSYLAESRAAETSHAVESTLEVKVRVATVLGDLSSAESALRGYVLTAQDEFLTAYKTAADQVPADIDGLETIVNGDAELHADVTRLHTLITDRMTLLAQLQALGPIGNGDRDRWLSQMREGQQVTETIKGVLGDIDSRESFRLGQEKSELEFAQRVAFLVAVVGTPIGALLTLLLVLIFTRKQLVRLRRIEDNMHRLESGQPLLEAEDANDELGKLGRLLVQSATQVIELQNELRHLATTDPLTRLMNRRGFLTFAERQISVASRTGRSLALMFMDVDGLKVVNDTLGHNVGDAMIAEAAHVIKATFRSSDLAARVGGDEFCVLLTSDEDVEGVQARLEAEVTARNAEPARPYQLSMSFGAAAFDPKDPRTLDDLMQEADAAMYEHKRAKRAEVA